MPRSLLVLALLPGCLGTPADLGGKLSDGPGGACEPVATVLGAEDTTPEGYTVASVVTGVEGERAAALSYDATGAHTDLTLEAVPDGEIRWIEETWVPTEGAAADTAEAEPVACNSRLEIDGALRFVTADGAFAELFDVVIVGNAYGGGRIDQDVDYTALAGSYVPTEIDPAEWDTVWLEWALNLSPGASGGEVALGAERADAGEEASATEGDDTETDGADDGRYESDMARFEGA